MTSADDASAQTRMRLLEGAQLCWVHEKADSGRSTPQNPEKMDVRKHLGLLKQDAKTLRRGS